MSQSDRNRREELNATVRGLVQGVGFRYYVMREARRLRLDGYVRNESNGDVEVVAQGSRQTLEQLVSLLWRGPSAAEVTEVQTFWREPTRHIGGFNLSLMIDDFS